MIKRIIIPSGLEDLLMDDAALQNSIKNEIEKYLTLASYQKIQTPMIEYLNVYLNNHNTIDEDSIIKLIDKDGRIIVLRPDITVPAARVVSTKLKHYKKPIKLYYSGEIFRYDSNESNKQREIYQIGAEIYGDNTIWSDIESIYNAYYSIKSIGIKSLKIEIGHAAIIKTLLKKAKIDRETIDSIYILIASKNTLELENLIDSLRIDKNISKIIKQIPTLYGDPCDVLNRVSILDTDNSLCEYLNYIKTIYECLITIGLKENIVFDLSICSNINYYTGIIFRGYCEGVGDLILSGGRYNSLMEQFGYNCEATGFAIFCNVLLKVLSKNYKLKKEEKYLIIFSEEHFCEALKKAEDLRSMGIICTTVIEAKSINISEYCNQYGFNKIIKY